MSYFAGCNGMYILFNSKTVNYSMDLKEQQDKGFAVTVSLIQYRFRLGYYSNYKGCIVAYGTDLSTKLDDDSQTGSTVGEWLLLQFK
jgi:hypothetical protein